MKALPVLCCTPNASTLSEPEAEELAARFKALADPTRVAIVNRLSTADEVCVCDLSGAFDCARLQQVFSNLLNNAVQHGARGLPVIFEARGEPDAVSVRVKNYGSPIHDDALQVIFNPLVQVPSPASGPGDRRSTSLGLGLFIARTIVAGHGGTLEVESSEQGGTVFTARLPRQ